MADDASFFVTLITSIYQLVIISCVGALGFVFYLYKTKMPMKEIPDDQPEPELVPISGHRVEGVGQAHDHFMTESSDELLRAVIEGLKMSDNVDEDEGLEEDEKEYEEEEEEQEEEEEEEEEERKTKDSKKRQVIREVTVRKLILPPNAQYSDVEKLAAKSMIGKAIEKQKKLVVDA